MISRCDLLAELIEQGSDLGAPVRLGLAINHSPGTIQRLGETQYQVNRRELGVAPAKQLTRLTFNGIAQNRRLGLLLRYHQAQPGM